MNIKGLLIRIKEFLVCFKGEKNQRDLQGDVYAYGFFIKLIDKINSRIELSLY